MISDSGGMLLPRCAQLALDLRRDRIPAGQGPPVTGGHLGCVGQPEPVVRPIQ